MIDKAVTAPTKDSGESPIDKNRLIMLIGTDDPKFIREIFQSFIEATQDTPEQLKSLIASKDSVSLRHAVHAAKGASASMGAQKLTELLQDLQDAADLVDWPKIEYFKSKVEKAFLEVHEVIQKECG